MPVALTVSPARAHFTTEFSIRASGLPAGKQVTLVASLIDDAGIEWAARGVYMADATGVVDVHHAPSTAGTFVGVDAAGLFWSMEPQVDDPERFMSEATERPHKLGQPLEDPLASRRVKVTVVMDDAAAARAEVELVKLAEGIETSDVRDGRLRGFAFRWKDRSRKRGAIMSLTGSGGGIEMNYAPLLASLGYDVFSLAYFAYEDLPSGILSIPLEYFHEGFAWMRTHFGCERIGIQGASRGGELSVLLAATFPDDVDGAIPIVPMYATSPGWNPAEGVDGPSWTLGDKPVPYPPSIASHSSQEMAALAEGKPNGYELTPWYRELMSQPGARENCAIPIENAGGPILLVSGVEDGMWPSAWGADMVIDRLRAKGFTHDYAHLALRETGHITPLPNQITTFSAALVHSLVAIKFACGGNPQGAARNSRLFWDAMVSHYRSIFGH